MTRNHALTLQLFEEYASRFHELLAHLNESVLPELIETLNNTSPHHFGKLPSEPLPTNERNLTDARTRIGMLLEYAVAFALDEVLKSGTYRAGFLVANQFPDITTRHVHTFAQGVRLEIKAIQAIAEEKAANFGTLVRDILPNQDLLCVLVWDWEIVNRGGVAIEYPRIYRAFALDALVVARIRDILWLSQPGRYKSPKLIDVAGALVPTSTDGDSDVYKLEEKNLGKLTRLIDVNRLRTSTNPILKDLGRSQSVALYSEMIEYALNFGVERVIDKIFTVLSGKLGCDAKVHKRELFKLGESSVVAEVELNDRRLYIIGNDTGRPLGKDALSVLAEGFDDCAVVIEMTAKFAWRKGILKGVIRKGTAKAKRDVVWEKGESGKKPLALLNSLKRTYDASASSPSSAGSI